jgi:hypothetical protein
MGPDLLGGFAILGVLFYFVLLAPLLLLALALPYVALRLRDSQNRDPDPQLGFRTAQYFFFSLGVLLALTGLSSIVVDLVQQALEPQRGGLVVPAPFGQPNRPRGEFPNDAQRTGAAMILSGLLFAGLHFSLVLLLTRERRRPSPTRRMFLGCRFAVHGIVVLIALTGLLIVVFQRSDPGRDFILTELRNFFIGVLFVWLPSWGVHFVLLRLASVSPSSYRDRFADDDEEDEDEDEERDRDRD